MAEIDRHDAHVFAARYCNAAIGVSPAGVVTGQPEIERRFAEEFETSNPRDFAEQFDEEEFSGDLGWLVGHWSETRLAPDGSWHPVSGSVIAVLEKRGGQWKAWVHVITLARVPMSAYTVGGAIDRPVASEAARAFADPPFRAFADRPFVDDAAELLAAARCMPSRIALPAVAMCVVLPTMLWTANQVAF